MAAQDAPVRLRVAIMARSTAFRGLPSLFPLGLGHEMQHYERWGLLILQAKCLRDGGRSQVKRNRTNILLPLSRVS